PLKPSRCCSVCLRLFPLPSHYGLRSEVYCDVPEHWRMVQLDPASVLTAWQAKHEENAAARSRLRDAVASLRATLDRPEPATSQSIAPAEAPPESGLDDAEIHARFVRMLRWLDEPPDHS
ncbi:MAG TPA: hypothetical protein VLA19_32505, partial [Herpetosiphonaceae bacterium]|nr:hypothetical protein [Herpetosiphonaceae bacterium]